MSRINIEAYPTKQAARAALARMGGGVERLFFDKCDAAHWFNGVNRADDGDTAASPDGQDIWVIVVVQE